MQLAEIARHTTGALLLLATLSPLRAPARLLPQPPFDQWTVPAAASAHGLNDTFFRSDLWIMNKTYIPNTIVLSYRCSTGCGKGVDVRLSLAPFEVRYLPDVVRDVLRQPESAGSITLTSQTAVFFATSRVASDRDGGTYGTIVPAVHYAHVPPPDTTAVFVGLASNAGDLSSGYRTNFGVMRTPPGPTPMHVQLELHDGTGAVLGLPRTLAVAGDAPVQVNDVFSFVAAGDVRARDSALYVTCDGPCLPYVTVIDNVTGDSVFLPFSLPTD